MAMTFSSAVLARTLSSAVRVLISLSSLMVISTQFKTLTWLRILSLPTYRLSLPMIPVNQVQVPVISQEDLSAR
jgi:hypothetical protein